MNKLINHNHIPIYRVVPASTNDVLNTDYSLKKNNRWNTEKFPALYACCSEKVAKAVIQDIYLKGGFNVDDLIPDRKPRIIKFDWKGKVVDMITETGLSKAKFNKNYPKGVDYTQTQQSAAKWHRAKIEGVVCRSMSLYRLGLKKWAGEHKFWGEIVIFVRNVKNKPCLCKIS